MTTHSRAAARNCARDWRVCGSGSMGRGELQQLENGLVDGRTALSCCGPGCRLVGSVPHGLPLACGRSVYFVRAMSRRLADCRAALLAATRHRAQRADPWSCTEPRRQPVCEAALSLSAALAPQLGVHRRHALGPQQRTAHCFAACPWLTLHTFICHMPEGVPSHRRAAELGVTAAREPTSTRDKLRASRQPGECRDKCRDTPSCCNAAKQLSRTLVTVYKRVRWEWRKFVRGTDASSSAGWIHAGSPLFDPCM